MHAEATESYVCCYENRKRGYGGNAPENHHPHTANPQDLHLPRPCPRERLSPLRRRGRPTAAAAAGRGGPEGTPTPAQRLRTERPATHPARRKDPAEGGANPQPGWSYDNSPPCGEPRMMFATHAPTGVRRRPCSPKRPPGPGGWGPPHGKAGGGGQPKKAQEGRQGFLAPAPGGDRRSGMRRPERRGHAPPRVWRGAWPWPHSSQQRDHRSPRDSLGRRKRSTSRTF